MSLDIIGIIIQAVIASCTVIAALSAFKSAKSAEKSMDIQRKLTAVQFQPLLSIYRPGHIFIETRKDGYAIEIILFNTSGGTANLKAVDASGDNVSRVDIGIPTLIGSGSETNITVWLKEREVKSRVNIALYYWDISGMNCYRTIAVLDLTHTRLHDDILGVIDQDISIISKDKPKGILHWRYDKNCVFDSGWLDYIKTQPNI